MSKMICTICWKRLEKSYAFAESLALAQQQLLAQSIDIKVEVGSLEPIHEPIESLDILSVAKDELIDLDAFNEVSNVHEPINTKQDIAIAVSTIANNDCTAHEKPNTQIESDEIEVRNEW